MTHVARIARNGPAFQAAGGTRRSFLRGVGALVALPLLESLRFGPCAASAAAPRCLAFIYVPNGVNLDRWRVGETGAAYTLSPTLEPLKPFKADFTLLSGLDHHKAEPNGDGAGDHSRAAATFLTGCQARKTGGTDIRLAASVDQIAAARVGQATRLPSLELTTDGERSAGVCDSGYSCAYQYNLSWKSETSPLPAERNPRAVFERLFGAGAGTDPVQRRLDRSVLDYVLDDARAMRGKVDPADVRKLDEYLDAVRDVEQRIERAEQSPERPSERPTDGPQLRLPEGVPASYQEHVRVMFDLMVLAFETDTTRVATFMLAHEGSNRSFPEVGVPEAHHQLSHHQNNAQKLDKLARIDRFYAEQLAYLLGRLSDARRQGGRRLLDQCMIVYGSGIADGSRHSHVDLPVLLAGRGGGTLNPGRHVRVKDGTPMTNLYLALLDRMGVKAERVGDSTGLLEDL